jgi:hypothetical protein
MSLYAVQKFIYQLKKDKALQQLFKSGPDEALAACGLSAAEAAALKNGDLAKLYEMGVHPLLLAPYSRFMGIPRPRYQELLEPLRGLRPMRS